MLVLLPVAAAAATVSGFVYGADDGEALSYADVYLQGNGTGRVANAQGYYIIAGLPAGEYEIVFAHVGYQRQIRAVELAMDQELLLSVELDPHTTETEVIEVDASRAELGVRRGTLSLGGGDINRIPAVIETDLLRSVQMMPGVSTLSDFSSGLYVRGGSADQNLILLDDADVYNPNHLFGFFSTFNVDAVKTVNLQRSGYPARYGGRLSSLLDVHNRDGNRKEYAGTARTSVIASSATVEGPWRSGSWMLSGRHTYIEQLAKLADIDLPYKFYDLHGKLNWDIGANDRLSISHYRGLDRLDWDISGLDVLLQWGNQSTSAHWTHLLGTRLYTHFVLACSRFDSKARLSFQDLEFDMNNEIDDISLKADASYAPDRSHTIEFGGEAKFLDFHFEQGYEEEDEIDFSYDGTYGALFAQEKWRISPVAELEAGLRLDYYSEGDYFHLGPRLSFRRAVTENVALHAVYGRYHQYLNLVSMEGASFADMWFPVDETLEPGRADHYIVGAEFGPYDDFDLTVEGYYKPYRNVVEFSEEFTRSLVESDAQMNQLFNTGTGEAYGGDFYLRNRFAGFEGWIGYSLGWTKREIDRFNFGEEYFPTYDRRHQFVLMQEKPLGKKWRMSAAFRYGTGQPVTLAAGRYTVRDITGREYDTVLDGDYHAYRLPDYHRLDMGLTYSTKWRGMIIEPNLYLINVYDRENVYIRAYDTSKNPVEFEDVTMLPFLPTVGVRVTF